MKAQIPKQCKTCPAFWKHGVKDNKHDRWCCHFGKPVYKVINHCKNTYKNDI